jgi:hypothetical protein
MLVKILIGLVFVVAVFVIVVAMQADDFKIVRSATIGTTPDRAFAIVNDIHRWNDWSPWAKLDPAMKTTYEGPMTGVGAAQSWSSDKVGTGKMTLIESRPSQLIEFRLDFLKPSIAGAVLADQIESLDWRARKAKHAGRAPTEVVDEVIAKVQVLLV